MPRTIIQAASLPAPPERLRAMYLSVDEHATLTGFPVTIAPRAGAEFRAFNGAIWGSILDVVVNRLVVQQWRSKNFPQNALDSTLVLSFWPEGAGGRIELVHANVPEEDFAGVSEGWSKFYWNPWRAYLDRTSESAAIAAGGSPA
jgi:activator of HSP90 ATPase